MATKEQVHARHGVTPVDDPLAEGPFWRRPLPPTPTRSPAENPAPESDPLADLPPVGDEAAHADERGGLGSSPQARSLVTTLSVTEASRLLAESHLRMARATDKQKTARGNVALSLAAFQTATMQTTTFEQLARQHIAASNQERADRVAGKAPVRPQRRLGSAVDAYAFYTKDHGRGPGGGRAFARGARPPSARGGVVPKE